MRSGTRGWIDISVPLKDGMVRWPSDPPVRIRPVKRIARGDSSDLSLLSMGSHTGTHMDAPAHFLRGGRPIDRMPLSAVIGPARVIPVRDPERITPEELRRHRLRRGERILFKTRNSAAHWRGSRFRKRFVHLTAESARYLVSRGVRTVGVDYLSVGGWKKDGAETHRALLRAGIWIIEGLDLSLAHPGRCTLICLPLKIFRGDGAPARAVLGPARKARSGV